MPSSSTVISRFRSSDRSLARSSFVEKIREGQKKKRSRIEANGGIKKWQTRHRVALKQIPTFPAGAKSVSKLTLVRLRRSGLASAEAARFSQRFEKALTCALESTLSRCFAVPRSSTHRHLFAFYRHLLAHVRSSSVRTGPRRRLRAVGPVWDINVISSYISSLFSLTFQYR